MSDLPQVYQLLIEATDASVEKLLLEHLVTLELPFKAHAVDVLLERRRDDALQRMIETRHELPPECQRSIAQKLNVFEKALREAIRAPEGSTRINAIDMISGSLAWSLAYILPMGLRSHESETRRCAADALLALVRANLSAETILPWSEHVRDTMSSRCWRLAAQRGGRDHLAKALNEAIASYDTHLRTTVVEAATRMTAELEPTLLAEARRWGSRFWRAAQDKLIYAPDDSVAEFVLSGMHDECTRGQMSKVLVQCTDSSFFRALWSHCWLLGDPAVRAGLQTIRHMEWLEHHGGELLDLPEIELRQALRFLGATAIPETQRIDLYKNILLAGGPDAQLTALLALAEMQHRDASEALQAVIHWGEPRLADIARRELRRRRPPGTFDLPLSADTAKPGGASAVGTARHRPEKEASSSDRETLTFGQYLTQYPGFDETARVRLGKALFEQDARAMEKLAIHLKHPEAHQRLLAMQIIRVLQLGSRCVDDIFQAMHDVDASVRSAAVKALEHIGGITAERLLLEALADGDARVRANAIEVLGAHDGPRRADQLVPSLGDPHHRVRTAAIDALLKLKIPEAAEALLALLVDPSRAHRTSGLWLIEKLDLANLVSEVSSMAARDPDPKVRRYARRLARDARRQKRRQLPIPEPAEAERPGPSSQGRSA